MLLAFAALAAASAMGAADPLAAEVEFTPTFAVGEEYSTNVDLDPEEEEESAWITSLTPGGRLRADGRRGSVAVDGGLTFRHQTAGDDEGWNIDLNLTGLFEAEIVPDLFLVEGGASVSQQTLDTEESAAASDQETVQVYRLSPILRWRAGSFATTELRYIFDQVMTSGDEGDGGGIGDESVSDETGHSGVLTISGGEDFRRLRWTAGGLTSKRFRDEDGDITRNEAEIAGEYALTRAIHPVLAVGYQTFDDEEDLEFETPTWRAGLHFVPNRRLDLVAEYRYRDERHSPALFLRYELGPRTRLFSSYEERLSTAQERLAGNIGFIAIDPETGNFIDERAGTAFEPRSDPFDIDDEVSRVRLLTLLVGHEWRRMSGIVRAGWGTEEEVETGEDEDVLTLDFRLQRGVSRRSVLETGLGFIGTDLADGQEDKEYFLLAGLRHRLSESLSLFGSYGYRWQDSTDPLSEFEEHRVGVVLFTEF
jgi:hypothetical protein